MSKETIPGLVIRSQSGFLWVETERGTLISRLRGGLTHGYQSADVVAVGDRVHVSRVT